MTYSTTDDNGKRFRAKSAIQVNAEDLASAYLEAEKANLSDMKLGAIIPGHHQEVP